MAPDTIQSFMCLAIGFAVAGLIADGYQALARHPLSFRLIEQGARAAALASVPLLVFAAPFIIMRHTLGSARVGRGHAVFVAIATAFAGFWSLMSGTVVAAGWVELVRLMA
jgi:hypothetical protein